MTDDLDDLRRALQAAPAPDGDARARAMTLAMENFDRLQGSADAARSSQDRPEGAAPLTGVRRMLNILTSRPALATSTSIAALIIGVAVILPVADLQVGQPRKPEPATAEVGQTEDAAVVQAEADPKPDLRSEAPAMDAPTTSTDADEGAVVALVEPTPEAEVSVLAEEALPAPPVDGLAVAPGLADNMVSGLTGGSPDMELKRERLASEADTLGYVAAPATIAPEAMPLPVENTEAYANEAQNPVKVTAVEPVSTFSIDVDTASYAVIRSSLTRGYMPTPDQVRIEEMVNYFPYSYPAPTAEAAFSSTISVMPTPWNPGTRLVTIGIQGALPAITERPPLNLVFLIDTSGSMEDANKLPLLKQSLSLMLSELRPEDQVSIVTYAGSAGLVLPPTAAKDRAAILASLENLAAGGSTAGAEGLELAYQVAEGMKAEGEVTRILLATDGDFNVGVSDPEGLEAYVAKKRESGTYLSVLGFGRGNLDDAVMQSLAQNGNGQAAYIDTLSEARKVLVDQVTGALFPIADDVKIQIEWNPATVAEYRLIGYETRALRREDFNNDAVDAGEIGAGTQVTAIYEVTAPGSDALLNDPLRYGSATATESADGELGFLRLRWKAPGAETSTLIETPITGREEASDETRFAAAIAGFGQLLQGSVYLTDWGWDEAIALAVASRGEDPFGYRIEAVNLMRLAQSLGQ
jgi:Ca-activated chloride channel homolog